MTTETTITTNLVLAVYEHRREAEAAVKELSRAGFVHENVSIVYTDAEGVAREGLIEGLWFGGIIGGLTGLFFPPVGLIVAAGPILGLLGGALTGVAVGAVAAGTAGAIAAALVQAGLPEDLALLYGEHIHKGDTVVLVHTDSADQADRAHAILDHHNPKNAHNVPTTPTAPLATATGPAEQATMLGGSGESRVVGGL